VHFQVVLGRMFRVLGRVQMVRVRHMRVVRGPVVISGLVRFGGFGVVMGGLAVMMRRLIVVMHCLFRHVRSPRLAGLLQPPASTSASSALAAASEVTAHSIQSEYAMKGPPHPRLPHPPATICSLPRPTVKV
jgi:hypothetical protein